MNTMVSPAGMRQHQTLTWVMDKAKSAVIYTKHSSGLGGV